MLADGGATCAVLLDSAVLAALAPDAVVVDLGTSGVDAASDARGRPAPQPGLRFVDAPVSGSVPAVEGGTLLVMASGAPEAVVDGRAGAAGRSRRR